MNLGTIVSLIMAPATGGLSLIVPVAATMGERKAKGQTLLPRPSEIVEGVEKGLFGPSEVEEIDQFMRTRPLSKPESFEIKAEYFRFYDPASPTERKTDEFLKMARNFKQQIQESEGLILVEEKPLIPSWVKPASFAAGILAVAGGVGIGIARLIRR